jgi:hypothetical protein
MNQLCKNKPDQFDLYAGVKEHGQNTELLFALGTT